MLAVGARGLPRRERFRAALQAEIAAAVRGVKAGEFDYPT